MKEGWVKISCVWYSWEQVVTGPSHACGSRSIFNFFKSETGLFCRESLCFIPLLFTVSCRECGTVSPARCPLSCQGIAGPRTASPSAGCSGLFILLCLVPCHPQHQSGVSLLQWNIADCFLELRNAQRMWVRTWKPTHILLWEGGENVKYFTFSLITVSPWVTSSGARQPG